MQCLYRMSDDRMRRCCTLLRFFDARTGTVAAVVIAIAWFSFVGGQVIAGGKLLQVTLELDLTLAIILSGIVILAYTTMGGLKAVIYTDVFQMIVLLIGILFLMVPIGFYKIGGWNAMVIHFEASDATRSMLSFSAIGWKQLVGWFLCDLQYFSDFINWHS